MLWQVMTINSTEGFRKNTGQRKGPGLELDMCFHPRTFPCYPQHWASLVSILTFIFSLCKMKNETRWAWGPILLQDSHFLGKRESSDTLIIQSLARSKWNTEKPTQRGLVHGLSCWDNWSWSYILSASRKLDKSNATKRK